MLPAPTMCSLVGYDTLEVVMTSPIPDKPAQVNPYLGAVMVRLSLALYEPLAVLTEPIFTRFTNIEERNMPISVCVSARSARRCQCHARNEQQG